MGFNNRIQTNFARGEVSPDVESRGDLEIFQAGLKLCRNYIPKFQGPVSYAPGSVFLSASSVTSGSLLIPFVYRDTQAYHLELFVDSNDDLVIRIMKDTGVLLYSSGQLGWVVNTAVPDDGSDSQAIGFPTGISNDPGFFSAGLAGAEVTVTIAGTFDAADIAKVRYAQSGSAMVIISEGKFCVQVWRGNTSETAWAMNEAAVVASSFVDISSIASDGNGYAEYTTAAPHDLVVDDIGIVKNTDLDNDYDGAHIVTEVADTTHFTTKQEFIGYTSAADEGVRKGGTFHDFTFAFEEIIDFLTDPVDITKEAKFNEGRLYFALDDKLYGSKSVVDGQDMYANFTQSITAIPTDAIEFTVSISSDKVDLFKWLKVSNEVFYAGMENLIAIVQGNTSDDPIAGDSIRLRSSEDRGSSDVAPIEDGNDIIFVDSTGKTISAFKFDIVSDGKRSTKLTLLNEHFFTATIKKITFQRGTPDIVWVLLTNGRLLGFIYNSAENITGWFEYVDGKGSLYSDVSALPISNGSDRLWTTVARSDGSDGFEDQIEQLELQSSFFKFEDFYTNDKDEDLRKWRNAVYEQQKHNVHMHSMLSQDAFATTLAATHYLHFSEDKTEIYVSTDGTAANKITGASSPLDGETGNDVVIKATEKGLGEGQYSIDDYATGTGISNTTEKKALADFTFNTTQSSFIIPPGSWGVSFSSITSSSLQRYFDSTGSAIGVVLDGGYVDTAEIVEDGGSYSVDLSPLSGTVIYFGYEFVGIVATLPIDIGGVTGTAFSKLKNIGEVRVDFIDSMNIKYGVDPYNLSEIDFRKGGDFTDRPPQPTTGTVELQNVNGGWGNKKSLYFIQDIPVPNTIATIDISGEASDDV